MFSWIPKRWWGYDALVSLATDLESLKIPRSAWASRTEFGVYVHAQVFGKMLHMPHLGDMLFSLHAWDYIRTCYPDYYPYIYRIPLGDLLTHINAEDPGIRIITQWRFRMGR